MFIEVYDRGHRMSRFRLAQEAAAVPGQVATRRGIPGKRLRYLHADETRQAFRRVQRFVLDTGYGALVDTTLAEAKALFVDGLVTTTGGTYRLGISADGSRLVTLSGHGGAL